LDIAFLVLLAPLSLLAVAATHWTANARDRRFAASASYMAVLGSLGVAAVSAAAVAIWGSVSTSLIGFGEVGLALRLDPLSVTMFLLVAFVGLIVVRFSRNYLDGDPRQDRFFAGLCMTLAAVILLILAGNVWHLVAAWIATSLALHRLLVFYPDRPRAIAAARKKFLAARLGDGCLVIAAFLVTGHFGTADIGKLLALAASPAVEATAGLTAAAVLIALAALLKSAQFPAHGWLIEVMETPTPVSALLHAGIVNAGGFLILRFADLMVLSPAAMILLTAIGGLTAIFGSLVMLCQTSAKVSLAYSTVAQMGFMMLQCGLGVFPIALLHIVAHSLYKAHAFLSAGAAAEAVAAARPGAQVPSGIRQGTAGWKVAVITVIVAGIAAYSLAAGQPAMVALGVIIAAGLSQFVVAGSVGGPVPLRRTAGIAVLLTLIWAGLHTGAYAIHGAHLPPPPSLGAGQIAMLIFIVAGFIGAAIVQWLAPVKSHSQRWQAIRCALANGLYTNAVFDRIATALVPSQALRS